MKSIVITGSTRGIGYGLADSFLERNCSVTICGRKADGVTSATDALSNKHQMERVLGVACDVRDPDQLQTLWNEAATRFGSVDIWINNAGMSGPQTEVWEYSSIQVKEVVETNLVGLIFASQTAVKGMLQQGSGSIYNMEGMGSDGRMHDGLVLYGMTKYGLSYFTKGLIKETERSSIIVGSIRPGMIVTDMIKEQYVDRPEEWERAKKIFNIIANPVEEVAPRIVDRVLQNEKSGVSISYMSRGKFLLRFLSSPFRKRDLFDNS
jgi:NAD(P)-dependent dehydrogenase (short-subunit alcohol dehydrogenase family)